jgi:hypothetical protein
MTVAAAVIGTAAATYAIGSATMTMTLTTMTPATPQWPPRYASRFISRM